ncbi:hypothetical protein AVEN_142770-1 [Araneus ventricosus]|uniref:Uncharacterized protein n=1 Tax=Araneus ventricosus TaxID=182803 RepID=A0A4Y2WKT3_ARAVE|nr:hypothetical protein AVEN_142770-1 [Araneus ventricosus]
MSTPDPGSNTSSHSFTATWTSLNHHNNRTEGERAKELFSHTASSTQLGFKEQPTSIPQPQLSSSSQILSLSIITSRPKFSK